MTPENSFYGELGMELIDKIKEKLGLN